MLVWTIEERYVCVTECVNVTSFNEVTTECVQVFVLIIMYAHTAP